MRYRTNNCVTCGGNKKMQYGGLDDKFKNVMSNNPSVEQSMKLAGRDLSRGSGEINYGNGSVKNKIDPYFALQGLQSGMSWLGNVLDRKRQDQYRYQQLSTLGQMDAMPVEDYQPNPYSLYAKYGGQMKKGGNWIPKDLHKGRCTPAPNPNCPVGSPQYNLSQVFKKHHGFHRGKK